MNKIAKTSLGIAAVAAIAGAGAYMAFAWGPSRTTYTMDKPADHVVFNSITDNNKEVGDERYFVSASEYTGDASKNYWSDKTQVENGKEYVVRMYVHNNAASNLNLTAENVRAYVVLPTDTATSITVSGKVYSSNANPTTVWDETTFTSKNGEKFNLAYVDGTAKYYNTKDGKLRTFNLNASNLLTNKGELLGYDKMDGKIPGCYQYDGVVTIEVKVHKSVNAKLSKTVRLKGTKNWTESVDAKVGDEVEFQIEYVNLLGGQADNVMIRDVLPTNLEYVKDSTVLYNSNYQNGTKVVENTLTTSGINIGSYGVNGNAYVRFTAKVVNKSLACGNNQLVNWASSTVNSKVTKDDASVMVKRDDAKCHEQPTPPTPPTPPVIPQTGATEVTAIALGAGSVVTVAGYAIASWKKR